MCSQPISRPPVQLSVTQRGPVYKAVRHSTAHRLLSHRRNHPIITTDAFWKFSKTCPNNMRSMFPYSCPTFFLSVPPEDFADQTVGWNDQPGSQKSQIRTVRTKADKPTSQGAKAARVYYRNSLCRS